MSDRFKFRAWDKKRNGFHVYIETYGAFQPVFDDGEELEFADFIIMEDRFTIQQSTGLKDKNGKLIYEGDIVKVLHGQSFEWAGMVTWGSGCYAVVDGGGYDMMIGDSDEYEIIGNVYNNPELMEGKES